MRPEGARPGDRRVERTPAGVMRKLSEPESFFLDAARYAAASMVVLYHALVSFFDNSDLLQATQRYYAHLGFAGVSIFFILSGFVIAYTVARKRSEQPGYRLGTYLVERFARISICLVPAVIVVALIDLVVVKRYFPAVDLRLWPYSLTTIFFMTGLTGFGAGAQPMPTLRLMNPVWSLSYEVYLYLLFGVAAFFAGTWRSRAAKAAAGVAALLLLSRLPYPLLMSYNWLLGVLIFALHQRGAVPRGRAACLGFLGAVVLAGSGVVALTWDRPVAQLQWIYVSLLALAFSGLVALFGTLRVGPRSRAAAKFLASYSYSMYLLQFALITATYNCLIKVRRLAGDPVKTTLFLAASFLAVNVLSWAFSLVTERQTSRLRRLLLGGSRPAGRPTLDTAKRT